MEKRSWLKRHTSMCLILLGIFLASPAGAALRDEPEDVSSEEFVPTPDRPFDDLMYAAYFLMNRDLDAAQKIGKPDHDFVSLMLAHHQGAINMAKVLLVSGTDREIRELAQGIIARQQQEILFMQDWLTGHTTKESTKVGGKKKSPFTDLVNKALAGMRNDLQEVFRVMRTEDDDHEFVNVMIPQRKGAVDLAKAVLTYGKDPKILDLAKKISKEQQAEIQLMQKWLKKHQGELPH